MPLNTYLKYTIFVCKLEVIWLPYSVHFDSKFDLVLVIVFWLKFHLVLVIWIVFSFSLVLVN